VLHHPGVLRMKSHGHRRAGGLYGRLDPDILATPERRAAQVAKLTSVSTLGLAGAWNGRPPGP